MSPNSVSAVLEKLIRRLCLGDFPCRYNAKVTLTFQLFLVCQMGHVCWVFAQHWPASLCTLRASDRSLKRQREDSRRRAEAEETRALLDLLRCPHSPWHQDHSWSPQAASLRELAVQAPQRLHANFVYAFFTSLCILEKDVSFFFLFGPEDLSDLIWNQWFCDVEQMGTLMWIFRIETLVLKPLLFQECTSISSLKLFFGRQNLKIIFY